MSIIKEGLEFQTNKVIAELMAIRKHIEFKLETADTEDRKTLTEYQDKVLDALNAL